MKSKIIKTSFLIIKLVIPFYILADFLIYFHLLEKISFIFEPFTAILGLNTDTSLALAAGMILNLYAAIAFAAPFNLSPYEWTTLGLFLGIAHSLPVENIIMKQLGISHIYSTILRITSAFLGVFILKFLPFNSTQIHTNSNITIENYNSFFDMLMHSLQNAFILSVKIIILISIIIIIMEFVREKIFKNKKLNVWFSLITGLILGITYGAGILIEEKNKLSKKEILFIATFLMICHSIIEDTALFALFGASIVILISIRLFLAVVISFFIIKIKGIK